METETETRDWTLKPTAGHETHGQSVIYDADGRDVAIVYDGDRDGPLIAAAPAQNQALQDIATEAEFNSDDGAMDLGEKLLRIQRIARAAVVTVEDEDDYD